MRKWLRQMRMQVIFVVIGCKEERTQGGDADLELRKSKRGLHPVGIIVALLLICSLQNAPRHFGLGCVMHAGQSNCVLIPRDA
ncbi:hypothetical protein [Rubritalea tangerina]|uniref:hypothetical protein n=1 Tax=Rubritalea tangerina TaxID=430798 RepID=UPI00360F09DB